VISKRPLARHNRGRVVRPSAGSAPAPPSSPLTILGAAVLAFHRADVGNGASWTDQNGNDRHYTQGTGANQPALNATGGPNSTPILTFDGANDFMQATGFALPDPGTTPTLIYMVLRQNATWTATRKIFGDSAGFRLVCYQNATTPRLRMTAGVDGPENAAAPEGTWVRMICYFSDTVGDYLTIKGTTVTGTSCNSAAGVDRQIGASAGILYASMSVAEITHVNRNLTAPELAQMDAYVDARYGAGLTT